MSFKTLLPTIKELLAYLFVLIAGAGCVFATIRYSMYWAARIHPFLSFLLGLTLLAVAIRSCPTLVKAFGLALPIRVALLHFAILSAGLIAAFAGLSSALISLNWASYDLADSVIGLTDEQWGNLDRKQNAEQSTIRTFNLDYLVDYYAWLYVDMIPVVDVWKTLEIRPKLSPANLVAGISTIAFRCMVLVGVIASWRDWKQLATESQDAPEGSNRKGS